MSAPRLRRALVASAAIHVAILAGLLALAHPRFRSAPTMRVALVGHAGATAGPARTEETAGGTHPGGFTAERAAPAPAERVAPVPAARVAPVADPGDAVPARPPPSRSSTRTARPTETRRSGVDDSGDAAGPGAEALVSAVQSDVWVLSGSTPAAVRGSGRPAPRAAGGPGAVGAPSGSGAAPAVVPGAETPGPGDGTEKESLAAGGQDSTSLLAALSQRLAWSAARCAPAALVRTTRHAVPGVPLHFCLDGTGRPNEVGLLGTTGSEVLDRAARDCVVPGALPLPPVPGCYTVEVRFPTRD